MAERTKPRIKYWNAPVGDPFLVRWPEREGWYVWLPDLPEDVMPECFDTWPQALAHVKQWYEEKDEQRRRIQGKIAVLVDRLKA